jgi:preprotein translocase subunit SecE
MSKIISFLQEVRAELAKVTWPKREDLIGSVIIVCFLATVFAVVIGAMDTVISFGIRWLIR